jgi:hypothetical protein
MPTPTSIQVAYDGEDAYSVDIINGNSYAVADSEFHGPHAKAKAEMRAEVLARHLGVEWETNYSN